MSEEKEVYLHKKDKLLWLTKRLKDVAQELGELSEEDKKKIIKKVDGQSPWALKEMYDSLNQYGLVVD